MTNERLAGQRRAEFDEQLEYNGFTEGLEPLLDVEAGLTEVLKRAADDRLEELIDDEYADDNGRYDYLDKD